MPYDETESQLEDEITQANRFIDALDAGIRALDPILQSAHIEALEEMLKLCSLNLVIAEVELNRHKARNAERGINY